MLPQKILVIQLRQLGDILLTTPCLTYIKRNNPQHHITFLSHKMGELILKDSPYVDKLLTYHESDSWRQKLALLQKLRLEKFDLVFDFMNNPRSALFTWCTGAKKRYGFISSRDFVYTGTVPRPQISDYIVAEKFSMLRAEFSSDSLLRAVDEPSFFRPTFIWQEKNLGPMHLLNKIDAFKNATFRVALSPTHRREARRWPLADYAALADKLCTEHKATVLWIWGPGEESVIDECIGFCRQPTIKAPATTLRELGAVLAHCDLFIGNSNGPSHIAVAVDICSLQLHGATESKAWCPMTSKHQAIQSDAMDKISLEQVWGKLISYIDVIQTQTQKRIDAARLLTSWEDSYGRPP